MPRSWPDKDPGSRLPFSLDFREVFDEDERILSVTWTISPITSPALVRAGQFKTDQRATIVLEGGKDGTVYTITASVMSDKGSPNYIWELDTRLKVRNI